MSTAWRAVAWFALWGVGLAIVQALIRVRQTFDKEVDRTAFAEPGFKPASDRLYRLQRAHINVAENLPFFVAVIAASHAMKRLDGTADTLAVVILCARLLQSVTHIASNSPMAVNVRFAGFFTQLICFAWLALRLLF